MEEHSYIYAGGKLLRETVFIVDEQGSEIERTLDFRYDNAGLPYALHYKDDFEGIEQTYYYITNLQGDVMYMVDESGDEVASYEYDPYGKLTRTTGDFAETNPLRYRGYYYDNETSFYYLQSRYYDPAICRFISADGFTSTGQGLVGYNMFTYCRNAPIFKKDINGLADEITDKEGKEKLNALLNEYATITADGFSIDIGSDTVEWDKGIKEVGIQESYDFMSDYLCRAYYKLYGEEFLFSNACVSYEIEYHVDAYMCIQGYSGYNRNITTYFLTPDDIKEHCKSVDISTNDVNNFKQKTMFGYKAGIRECYKYTDKDPYVKRVSFLWWEGYYR